MPDVVSFRFTQDEIAHIQKVAVEKKVDRTAAARELIEYGWNYYILTQYRLGKLSLEKTAKELRIPMTDLIDLLAELGIQSPIQYEEYLEGLKNI